LAVEISSMSIEKGLWWLRGKKGFGRLIFLIIITGFLPFTGDIIPDQKRLLKFTFNFRLTANTIICCCFIISDLFSALTRRLKSGAGDAHCFCNNGRLFF
jgi:hypothetical protein